MPIACNQCTASAIALSFRLKAGTVGHGQPSEARSATEATQTSAADVEAICPRTTNNGREPLLPIGHFGAKGNRGYQEIVPGTEKAAPRVETNTFLCFFTVN